MTNYIKLDPDSNVNDFLESDKLDIVDRGIRFKDNIIQGRPNSTRYEAEFYKFVGLDIVSETVFDYPYPCITEKTVKPIAMKRLFIVVGPAHVLDMLHSKGFKTFGHIIDESYDDEEDPAERFELVKNAIREFCSFDIDKVQQIVNNSKDILEHNFKTLCEMEGKELDILYKTLKY